MHNRLAKWSAGFFIFNLQIFAAYKTKKTGKHFANNLNLKLI